MTRLTLTRPDDWHLHLRDGAALASVLAASARQFARAIVMPNLKPPVRTVAEALAYRQRILDALPPGADFQPLMTLYLTDNTRPEEIAAFADSTGSGHGGEVVAVKYYPAGATTHSEFGVTDLRKVWPVLEAMQQLGVPLLIHGEVTTPTVDVFDRERVFIELVLDPLLNELPALRVVLEHITTGHAARYILAGEDRLVATVTAHHLLLNRNAIFSGGIRPHHYCLPVLKREDHRLALLSAIGTGSPRFFLGTDSAPHGQSTKECACGCAGIYSAPAALELYAEAFEQAGILDKLEAFAAFHGPDFYRLPRNQGTLTLEKRAWQMPDRLVFGGEHIVPLRAGETVAWQMLENPA
jgi:dihydroorotase